MRGLFAQVYLHGLLLLATVVLSTFVVGFLTSGGERRGELGRAARYVAAQLGDRWEDRDALLAELERQHRSFGHSIAAYDRTGALLGSAGDSQLPLLSDEDLTRLFEDGEVLWLRPHSMAAPIRRGERVVGYAVGRSPFADDRRPLRAVAVIATIASVLALVSIPLVKRIVRPLRVIGDTTRTLGEGDLSARTGLDRRDEIGQLARQVDDMAESLERSSKIERELLANVSHELRTPMARLRVALELAGEVGDDRRAELLADALRDVDEVDALTEDILMSARLERGGALVPEEHEVGPWIESILEGARRSWPGRSLVLAGGAGRARFDAKWLGRAVANVVENALKYSEDEVTVSVQEEDGLAITVRDRGIGIPEAERERIFAAFYRVGEGSGGRRGGFGLGLTLARRVVKAHGGRLRLESEEGRGSTFTLQIPKAPPLGSSV